KLLNSKNQVPLFMSVDEEGGRISRMPDQLEKLPTNEAIGKINDVRLSFNIGGILATELKAFGFNMDFAPVIDIFSNPKNTVIGDRAFGSEPNVVSTLGVQTMKGLQEGGVISVVKHFPGHGDTLVDSHIGLPTVDYGLNRLESFEFKPFQAAIDNKADAVMIAHILIKAIDPNHPASMSKTVITDVLRNRIGFSGTVITDDMTMGAIIENYKIGNAVVKSVNAGSDIILVCHGVENQVNAINALKASLKNGTITEERLNASVYRILKLKERYAISDKNNTSFNVDEINKKISSVLSGH
ncbi:MAG: beta-N-acetylhexosaminidase, partial [Candidatus Atribacteria bacterium]|nr:beta-N-acetylhexosaminidase [Candidatus Atribacteria bacterium]